MKQIATVVVIIIGLNQQASCQSGGYVPIPDDAKWLYTCTVTHVVPPPVLFETEIIHELLQLSGDTTIDSQSYKKVQYQRLGGSNVEVIGALRQDQSMRKVYGYSFLTSSESVVYDFNLLPNDTVQCETWFYPRDPIQLSETELDVVDSIMFILPSWSPAPGEESPVRLTYFRESGWLNSAIWAEGIGSLFFLGQPCSSDGEFTTCQLTGFCGNDTLWSPWESACELTVNIKSTNSTFESEFEPYWDGKNITFASTHRVDEISIYDLEGKEITYDGFRKTGALWKVSRPHVNSGGLYIIKCGFGRASKAKLIYICEP